MALNRTHNPARRSWLSTANSPETEFPIQNLPFGIFRHGHVTRGGIAIGDRIVDLARAARNSLFTGLAGEAASAASGTVLNPLMRLGRAHASALRSDLADLLDASIDAAHKASLEACMVPMAASEMLLPVEIGAFTDFLTSTDHMLRMGGGKLPPAFKRLPIAYNSRATSIVVSGTDVVRPNGQSNVDFDVVYGPEPWLDFELEMGAFVGPSNELGVPVPMRDADEALFGYCLLNDWSARGIQFFESMPLGPFLGKSFRTSISPWVVTADALEPYRVIAPLRAPEDAAPPHLDSPDNLTRGAFDVELEAFIVTPKMRGAGMQPFRLTVSQFRDMYWTFAQMLAHHTSNGCNMRVGDLLGSGTTSGASEASRACLGEITARGTEAFELPSGESRIWLEDGDEVIFRGHAVRDGYPRIGFGECRGKILPAPAV